MDETEWHVDCSIIANNFPNQGNQNEIIQNRKRLNRSHPPHSAEISGNARRRVRSSIHNPSEGIRYVF